MPSGATDLSPEAVERYYVRGIDWRDIGVASEPCDCSDPCTLVVKAGDYDALRAELARVQAERDSIKAAFEDRNRLIELQLEDKKALQAERDAMREDAERYRWLREQNAKDSSPYDPDVGVAWVELASTDGRYTESKHTEAELDAAIDAAMKDKP
jgi:hypothetical protein